MALGPHWLLMESPSKEVQTSATGSAPPDREILAQSEYQKRISEDNYR
jgi:hypothetical protein